MCTDTFVKIQARGESVGSMNLRFRILSGTRTYDMSLCICSPNPIYFYVITLRRGRPRMRPREQLLLQNYKA